MIWLSWRQFRLSGTVVAAAVALAAAVLAVTRPELVPGVNVVEQLTPTDRTLYFSGLIAVAVVPAVLGAFWGAPLVARELEAGTHRLVWNQSVTRTRWLATKLGLTTLVAAAAVGGLTLAVHRWSRSLDGALSDGQGSLPSRMTPVSFAMRGIAPVSYAVFAVVLGVTVGLLLRRTVPAMAVTLALFAFVQIAAPLWVRPHLLEPARETVRITADTFDGLSLSGRDDVRVSVRAAGAGAWTLSNRTVDPSGRVLDTVPVTVGACHPPALGGAGLGGGPVLSGPEAKSPLFQCLAQLDSLGYQQQVTYLPASRFWALQWAETGVFLGLSALLAAFCFRRVRRV